MKKQNLIINFIFQLLITSFFVIFFTFIAIRLIPGDPISDLLGDYANPKNVELMRTQFGLNLPIHEQFIRFLSQLIHGDLGTSVTFQKPVIQLISEKFSNTFILAFLSTILANVFGIFFALIALQLKNNLITKIFDIVSLAIISIPNFWLGPLLVIAFALHWPWLPISSNQSKYSIILPCVTLGLGMSAVIYKTALLALRDCMQSDYLKLALAKGNSEWRVLFVHALPNSFIPIITVTGLQFGHLLAGAIVTETIFDWPGIGKLTYDAILSRDYFTVQGVVLIASFLFVFINQLIDLVRLRLSPKETI